jgi:RNA polymerase sigma-54 factor
MLDDPATDEESRKYLQEKLTSAENLIKSLDLREDTLRRLTGLIVKRQAEFFRSGVEYLQPMTMNDAAKELDLNESTVSRAVAGKYIDTPYGVFEYKFFFSGGYTAEDGEDISSRAVKEKIRNLIDSEEPRKPLSDEAISKLLAADGLKVARRTVTKYRESMDIPATNLRRQH